MEFSDVSMIIITVILTLVVLSQILLIYRIMNPILLSAVFMMFKGSHFPQEVILETIRYHHDYKLSYREIEV